MSEEVRVRRVREGCLVSVRASPGASRDGVAGIHGDALKIRVAAPPEKGRANRALGRLLARLLDVSASDVCLHAGETSRDKVFLVTGLPEEELRRRLSEAVG